MSRRLVNRIGGGRAQSSVAVEDPPPDRDVSYETLSFPLNDHARNRLGELSRSRDTTLYQNQMKDSLRSLGLSVYDLQQRLQSGRERLEQLRTRREERGLEKTADEERLAAHVERMEREVGQLTDQSEAAVRQVIDLQAELEDDSAVLRDLYTKAAMNNQTRQTRHQDATGDQNGDTQESAPPVQSTLHELQNERTNRRTNYKATEPYQLYALDNDYIAFKKLWHDGLAGDDGPPLPDASKWFRADGTPVMGTSADAAAGDGGDDSDEELAVAREVISINCPLTLRPLAEPYSNRKCKHTFEKSAILDYLHSNRELQCPQTGCSEV